MNSYFLSCYAAQLSEPHVSNNLEDITCPLDQDLMDSLCPVNIVTGLREDPLVLVNDPDISDSEREALLASLPKFNVPKSDIVDDETKLLFTKLRSLQTPSELAAYRSSIQDWLDTHDQQHDPSPDSSNDVLEDMSKSQHQDLSNNEPNAGSNS